MKKEKLDKQELLNFFKNIKIEGYWYSKYEQQYSMPISNILTKKEAKEIYDLIIIKEKNANELLMAGPSKSRITNEYLGCNEYIAEDYNWRWPGDFASHYVLEHRVKPTDEFLKFVGYKFK